MGQAKQRGSYQQRVEQAKNSKGAGFYHDGQTVFNWGKGPVMMTAIDEVAKAVITVLKEPAPYSVQSNAADLKAELRLHGDDGGFLYAVYPDDGTIGLTEPEVPDLFTTFQPHRYSINGRVWAALTCFCSKDQVWDLLQNHLYKTRYVLIGYSTPEQLSIIAECGLAP